MSLAVAPPPSSRERRSAARESYRRLAERALASWDLGDFRLTPLEHKTNVTYRIDAGGERYLLRLCHLGAYSSAEIRSELAWLRTLLAVGLTVPEPVAARGGDWVVRAKVDGLDERCCVLTRWVPGEMLESAVSPARIEQVGELAGRLHRTAEQFVPPAGFTRPRWDADRLFGPETVVPPGRGEPIVTARTRAILDEAAAAMRRLFRQLGEGPEVFGMIHKDLEPDNTVLHAGEIHAIDFADCGWGYYLYDVAASLLPLREKQGYPELRRAFLAGYQRARPLPDDQWALLDAFLVARSLFTIRFMVLESIDERPEVYEYAQRVVPLMVGEIRRFLGDARGAATSGSEERRRTTVVRFLARLREHGVELWAEGEKLRFQAPRGALTTELRDQLKARRDEVLAFLHQSLAAVEAAAVPSLTAAAGEQPAPLSFAQQRLWFIDQLSPGGSEYNISRTGRLQGELDAGILERSLNEVIRRHAVLRTTFTTTGGEPVQVIAPATARRLPLVDLGRLGAAAQQREVRRVVAREAHRPFDLERGPLLRIVLLRLSAAEHVAASTLHHIVSDGWSAALFFREMGLLYDAFSRGVASPLPELRYQYADFARWQQGYLRGEVLEKQLDHWREQLAGAPPTLDLPTDRPRPSRPSAHGNQIPVDLPAGVAGGLRQLLRGDGTTLFMVLFAAFNVLLHRLSGQADLVLGVPIANRNRTEIEGLIGFFVNTLALRTRLSVEVTFRQLLDRVRTTTLGAYAHQDLPFDKLVEELRPQRDPRSNPLFQVMFTLQNAPREALELPRVTLSFLSTERRTVMFDLTLSLEERGAAVTGLLKYRTDLFDETTIRRWRHHLVRLAASVAADPDRRVSELELLAPAERRQLLVEWNDTRTDFPAEKRLHELFADRTARGPEAVAVLSEHTGLAHYLSYRELDRRAERLAGHLQALGVGPDVAVAICLERSPEIVVGLLGILKAGGAYVPLDPESPRQRLAYMIADSRAGVLVTREQLLPLLPAAAVRVVCLDQEIPESAAPAASRGGPDNLAYVIYTSGSTGHPKGVMMHHRGAVNRLLWSQRAYPVTAADRVLQKASFSFDFSVWECFGTLLAGARLVLARPGGHLDAAYLTRTLTEERITLAHFVPSVLRLFLSQEAEGRYPCLRCVFSGGEALSAALRDRFFERVATPLRNQYGPTEAAIDVTSGLCRPHAPAVAIGSPLDNCTVYVLSASLQPVPPGVFGELFLGGVGLARGYLGRPGRSAEKFVPDPFAAVPGTRLYRTGDLVRWLPNGELEFRGRLDHQVQLRGIRIELGEVEAALASHPGIREAVAMVDEASGDQRLVAYVVVGQEALATGDLRGYLRERLPEYMVPSTFVRLPALPLQAGGKVDRRALPAPVREQPDPVADPAAPRGWVEEVLAGIWAEVLRVERVGVEDDFFDLGGHSLLATQVTSRVRAAFGVELSLRTLFEAPTVRGLARRVEQARSRGLGRVLPPLEPVPRAGLTPLSFAQQRLWFLDQLEPASNAYNMPAAVRLRGDLRVGVLQRVLDAMRRRHESLRTTFGVAEGRPHQRVAAEHPLPLPVVDLRSLPLREREAVAGRRAREEAGRPFDLAAGPLIRVTLLRLADAEHVALLTLHHIISDGWSMGVLMRELAAFYAAFAGGGTPLLPELPVQYADFACWQRRWLTEELLEAEVAHWQGRLAGAPPSLDLPTDRPRPPVETARAAACPVTLSAELAAALNGLARRSGATPFMVLLAGFQALLGRHAGTEDVVVGSPIAGRRQRELEGLVGFFVNTLVLRTDLAGDPSFGELLQRAREVTLDAYDHQDVPFERLVEAIEPRRDLSRSPLFQVLFILQNVPASSFELPGVAMEALATASGTAKFDLTLSLEESAAGVRGTLEYNADLFEATTLVRLVAHFGRLLAGAAENPERPLSALPWLSPAELQQLHREWNAAPRPAPLAGCLHELFAAQAARRPEAAALRFADAAGTVRAMSYRELDERAERLAHRLRGLGVGRETRVGLCAERRPEMVAALLAVLKAGGAYVPLDPSYPASRLAFMLEDAGVRVLVADPELLDRLPDHTLPVVRLEAAALSGNVPPRAPSPSSPRDLAYLIYTSGSTGRPKGVAIEHRSAVALLAWAREVFRDDELAGVLASTSINFDLSIFELFLPLAVGGTLVLAGDALELPRLAGAGVRLVNTVPSAAAELARQRAFPPSVRTVSLAGEPLRRSLVERLYATGTIERVYNLYGPSEDTTYSTFTRVDAGHGAPTIGFPVAGTRAYVLDRRGRPVAVGVAGELHLGGDGLSRGYLGRPARTAGSYVPDPFGHGERLYRTGDLVRRLATGELAFLGRLDHQVKVRGFRIELGEIEAALAAHPAVQEQVVVAREDTPGDPRLVAYVEPGMETGPLRRFLAQRLPAYMVPSAFVALAELPRTPNGKVDRRALPAPERAGGAGAPYQAARDPIEEVLVDIWREVLGLDRVGTDDNFFELGGHSLRATQVVFRTRETLAVDLPLRALFEAPTVAGLAGTVRALAAGDTGLAAPPLERARRDRPLPLSFAQQRLWFLESLGVVGAAYVMPVAARFRGGLRPELLERALGEVVRRHEVLRTDFVEVDGEPRQRIAAAVALPLVRIDLRALPAIRRDGEARRRVAAAAARPFDLACGPLVRAALLCLAADDDVLVLTMHHAVSDGWSIGVLLREVAALYGAFARGEPSPLAELRVQYADFASWQRGWLRGETLAAELDHWRRRRAGAPPTLELPVDRPYPAVQTFRGATCPVVLSPRLGEALAAWSRQQGATLFMALLAAFDAVLGRHAGQDDVVVGTPVAGRHHREIEGLIGFFVNTLALRADLRGDPGFAELVARVRQVALDAFSHQEVPFEQLVEELAPRRDLSRDPVFQVVFALQNVPRVAFELPGLEIRPLDTGGGTAKFDLTLFLEETSGGLRGAFEYRTDLFDATTVARLAGRFGVLLEDAVAHPERRISELALLRPAERHQTQSEWNPSSGTRGGALLPRRVEAWASRRPQAPAVVAAAGTLSYAELDARANRLAHHLRTLGVGPETRVGVSLERSPEEIVALLAVWKAGGAYLPIDPAYPAERRRFLVDDAAVEVLLTSAATAEALPAAAVRQVRLDRDAALIAGYGHDRPAVDPDPDHLAYVIYTSGSTGRPKGVEITHRTLLGLVAWHERAFRVTAGDRATRLSGLAFDASVWELWPYLAAGAAVHVPDEATRVTPDRLRDWLLAEGVTISFVPTPVAEILLALDWPRETALRLLLTGGDALRRCPPPGLPFALINNYGPTESTVVATSGAVPAAKPGATAQRAPSLGRPIGGVRAYLLDGRGRPVGIGVPGELWLGGAHLARGYLRRPGLTAERFAADSFAGEPGARMYRTGDRVRLRTGGELDFLGRLDHQVKVRGFRIELGEIEALLATHRAVRECLVLARGKDGGGERRLVAYVVGVADAPPPEPGELRSFLAEKLPEYMVPAAIVTLPEWPLTSHGKVDRQRLPAPEQVRRPREDHVAPRDEVELELARLWEETLGVAPVGMSDDFFELGGHSLLAVRLIAGIRRRFGQELPLAALFQQATVEALAARLRRRLVPSPRRPRVALRAEGTRPPLFCVHPVGGNVLCYVELVRSLEAEQPVYGLQVPAAGAGGGPDEEVEPMAARYLEAVREAQPRGPYLLAGWSMGGLVAFEMARRMEAAGEPAALVALLDTAPPAGPSRGPEEDEATVLAHFARDLAGIAGRPSALTSGEAGGLAGLGLEEVFLRAQAAGLLPPELELPRVLELYAMFKANYRALRRYAGGAYGGKLSLLRAAGSSSAVEAGWKRFAAVVEVDEVPGDHYSMLRAPAVAVVGERLAARLERALTGS